MVKRKLEKRPNGPVSAFAARRATQEPKKGNSTVSAIISTSLSDQDNNRPSRPAKRRKIKNVKPSSSFATQTPPGEWTAPPQSNRCTTDKPTRPLKASEAQEKCVILETDKVDYENEIEDDHSSSDTETYVPSASLKRQLSSFVPSRENVQGETNNEWTICLGIKDTVTLVGSYDVWVRRGTISIDGAILHASSRAHRVYAPSTHSLPFIQPLRNPFLPEDQLVLLTISSYNTRIRMLRELTPKFGRIWNHRIVSKKDSMPLIDLSERSFVFLKSSDEDPLQRPLRILEIPDEWQMLINGLKWSDHTKPPAVIICGPKASGKSTFCRVLANSMLTNTAPQSHSSNGSRLDGLAFLDLDSGQPEYSPPGEVSLIHVRSCNLGVPFTHPTIVSPEGNTLIKAHHVGAVSIKDDPDHYQRCALDLLHHYSRMKLKYPLCPLIVNCSGWIQGSGLEVVVELIRHWTFSTIVYTSKAGPVEVVETLADSASQSGVSLSTLTSQPPDTVTRTAVDLRMMQTLSYFHLAEPENGYLRWNPSLINEIPPVIVRYAGAGQAIFAVMILGEEQDPDFYRSILEGSVVGLVVVEDDTAIYSVGSTQSSVTSMGSQQGLEHEDVAQLTDEQTQAVSMQAYRDNGQSDSESDQASMNGSRLSSYRPRPPKRRPSSPELNQTMPIPSREYFTHPAILRTSEDIPYLSTGIGTNRPLDPSKSHSIGQALIRGINTTTKTFQLITPIPQQTFQAIRQQNTKIVLVRGKLDTPTWAYREEYTAAAARRRRTMKEGEKTERFGADEMRAWAEGIPWAKVVDGKESKSYGAKVWKVRRNLRDRGSGAETE